MGSGRGGERNKTFDQAKFFYRLTRKGKGLFPGLLAVVTVAIALRLLSEHYGGPTMLFALLLGMAFHFLVEEGKCGPGIQFASRTVLQVGVALLGLGITVEQIHAYGWGVAGIVVAGILPGAFYGDGNAMFRFQYYKPDEYEEYVSTLPQKRMPHADEYQSMLFLLAESKSMVMSGSLISMDCAQGLSYYNYSS